MKNEMMYLDYCQGYKQALIDLQGWMFNPGHRIDKQLMRSDRFRAVLNYIIENIDEFSVCPEKFEFEYDITKRGIVIHTR